MKPIKSQDYYEMLDVPRYASQDDIRRAFEICKHTYRDDSLATYSLFSEEESREIFSLMSQAYNTLKDPAARRDYDSYLSKKEGRKGATAEERERMVASMIGIGTDARAATGEKADSKSGAQQTTEEKKPASPRQAKGQKPDSQARVEKFIESVRAYSGPVLKKVRGLRGISLEELSEQTKIRKTYLQYLEEEQYEFLPAPVYIKGFINIIAGVLGLPTERVAEDYMLAYRESHDKEP